MRRCAYILSLLFAAGLCGGCVERKFLIETNPPGAFVQVNDEPLGPAPVNRDFVYYGKYRFTIFKEGFEPLTVEQNIPRPWYQWWPIDFFSEVLWPFEIVDQHYFPYDLTPQRIPDMRSDLDRGEQLRQRGQAIQPEPEPARLPAPTPVPPTPGPAVMPPAK
jgi:PEGA domain